MRQDDTAKPGGPQGSTNDAVPVSFGFGDAGDGWLERIREVESATPLGRIGEFEVLEEAGRGAQGVVYKARRAGTDMYVALKRLVAGSFATQSMRDRFDREIDAASTLSHCHPGRTAWRRWS